MTVEALERAHLLVVDDDPRIRTMLSRYFEAEGYRVSLAENAAQLRRRFQQTRPDLILLDLGLPDADGIAMAREVRSKSDVGIIIVTGRMDDVDRIVGLEVGADDYIMKPFNLREVLARVRSVLRRLQPAGASPREDTERHAPTLRFGGWSLDVERRRLTAPHGFEVPLTTGEFDILQVFVRNAGRVLSRDFLMDQTRGRTWEAFDRTIDAQISRLRRKLERDPKQPALLKSVRGVGYFFAEKVE